MTCLLGSLKNWNAVKMTASGSSRTITNQKVYMNIYIEHIYWLIIRYYPHFKFTCCFWKATMLYCNKLELEMQKLHADVQKKATAKRLAVV